MYVSSLFVRVVLADLSTGGISADLALLGTGVDEAALATSGGRVAIEQLDLLLARAAELTGNPAFGLALGARVPSSALHVLSCLLLASPTLRVAIDGLMRHAPYLSDGVRWELQEQGDLVALSYHGVVPCSDGSRIAADAVMAVGARVLHWFTQQKPHGIEFRHPAPIYAAQYHEQFGCPVQFERPQNALSFPRALLDRRQAHGDPNALTFLHDLIAQLFHRRTDVLPMSERVRLLLRGEMLIAPDYSRIAQRLGVPPRTLRRRLAQEGVCLSRLVDEARLRAACEELGRARPCIREMSKQLGYSEPSAFARAFKRWTGKTPLQFSREVRPSTGGAAIPLAAASPRSSAVGVASSGARR
jgi:AraC-like DNA-binding protein